MNLQSWNYITDLTKIRADDSSLALVVPTKHT